MPESTTATSRSPSASAADSRSSVPDGRWPSSGGAAPFAIRRFAPSSMCASPCASSARRAASTSPSFAGFVGRPRPVSQSAKASSRPGGRCCTTRVAASTLASAGASDSYATIAPVEPTTTTTGIAAGDGEPFTKPRIASRRRVMPAASASSRFEKIADAPCASASFTSGDSGDASVTTMTGLMRETSRTIARPLRFGIHRSSTTASARSMPMRRSSSPSRARPSTRMSGAASRARLRYSAAMSESSAMRTRAATRSTDTRRSYGGDRLPRSAASRESRERPAARPARESPRRSGSSAR